MTTAKKDRNILWFEEIDKEDLPLVGGKGANLGEMCQFNIPVPPGFVVTVKAYYKFLDDHKLREPIKKMITGLDVHDSKKLQETAEKIKKLIRSKPVPKEIGLEIMKAYLKMNQRGKNVLVATRSSATAEDLPDASFAGQQATYLNVKGENNVVEKVRACWASLFEPRAIFYRDQQNFDHFKVGIAVPVQEMVQSEISGVMFTTDPISAEKNIIMIEAIYGLGDLIVRGEVIPDRFLVDRQKMTIANKEIGKQEVMMIKTGTVTKRVKVPRTKQSKQKISDQKVLELAAIGKKIHNHYYFPQDIEWAQKGNKLYILQTRPITTLNKTNEDKREIEIKLPLLVTGSSASPGLVVGKAKKIPNARQINKVKKGDILVTTMTTPDFVPAMKRAAAIVTDMGGQTSHAAIVSRELGVPCIIGTKIGTKKIRSGQILTVHASKGNVYQGGIDLKSKSLGFEKKPAFYDGPMVKTATKIYANLGQPERAEEISRMNVDGVGLLRAEFMMAEIGQHPKKVIQDRKQKTYVNELTEGIATFCKAFSPRPVVYRTSDFKTNEYRNLVGGSRFEPKEENPLIGFRGAGRYLVDEQVFELELEAVKKVRNKLGFKNLWVMVPFVRTPEELQQVKRIMAANGLSRTSSFQVWLMVEIPANVILLEEFIKVGIDGVSIGSNDLTMLTLGVDRDNAELKDDFNEMNPAVLWALERTIKTCLKHKITCSICGQA
ncbi:phosphoenolpyruvate synthase, partial [Patescibacteria group bacterium]|nr:phosphoenolpyruvate synthase [Patescibacteria group bacterium]